MNLSKKNLLLISGIVLMVTIVITSSSLKLTAFATKKIDNDISIPSIKSGEEKVYLYNKYSNNSGIIVSTPTRISCNWKPDREDDGWKECEAIFEIDDKTKVNKILTSPEIALNFKDEEEIKNIEITYSQDFEVVEESYPSSTKEAVTQDAKEENQNKKGQTTKQERIKNFKEKLSTNEEKAKTITKHENIKFEKREFFDFSTAPIIENISSTKPSKLISVEQKNKTTSNTTVAIENKTTSNTTVAIENKTNKTKDVILKVNLSQPEVESNLSIMGNVIKMINPSEDFSLKINKPFAIKITFEIPKYNSNTFNFSISDKNFKATIDPDISGCGTLSTENAIYSLTQNLESIGACLAVTANNITIDCQGHSIRYSSSGSPAYGVYSTASSTKVRNCAILSGDLNTKAGAGIYFSNADDGEIQNNTFTIDDIIQEAILLENSARTSISNNELDISATASYGIYLDNSDSSTIINNDINSSVSADAIYMNSSDRTTITNNTLVTSGAISSTIFILSSLNSTITNNTLSTFERDSHGIYLEDSSYGDASGNNISTVENDAYGFFLIGNTDSNTFSENTIYTAGIESNGFSIVLQSNSNTFSRNNITASGGASCSVLLYRADANTFTSNSFQTLGEEGYGVWIYDSTNTTVHENTFNTFGADSPALILDIGTNSNIGENTLTTIESNGHGIEIDSFSNSNIFNSNQINTSGNAASGIFFLTNSINNYFQNSNIKTSGTNAYSVYVWGANNTFGLSNGILDSSTDLFIRTGVADGVWNFTNTTLSKNWSSSSNGTLNVKWNLDILTNYTNGTLIPNVDISAQDRTSSEKFSTLTSENGRIARQTLTEYTQTDPITITYYSNYSIQASLLGETLSQSINMSENKDLTFTFSSSTQESNTIESSSAGGSSGGATLCISEWECSEWEECINKKQLRICTDKNNCITPASTPETERECERSTEVWNMRDVLFDINLEILKNSDGTLSGAIGLINLGAPGEVAAHLDYKIKNSEGETIYEENEIVSVETQIEFIKELTLPDLPGDEYTWSVELTYEGQTEPARAQASFTIEETISPKNTWLIILALCSLGIIIRAAFFINKKRNERLTPREEGPTKIKYQPLP